MALSVIGIGLLSAASVRAQDNYPWKPIQLVVTTAAGGALDLVTRTVADRLSVSMHPARMQRRDDRLAFGANNVRGVVVALIVSPHHVEDHWLRLAAGVAPNEGELFEGIHVACPNLLPPSCFHGK